MMNATLEKIKTRNAAAKMKLKATAHLITRSSRG
jgi:hypothetical protein